MSLAALVVLVVGLSMAGTFALVLLARVSHPRHKMEGTADIEGVYVTVLGTLYAIFLAFMIFVVWTRFYQAQEDVDQEANTLVDIYRLADRLPEPIGDRLKEACEEYLRVVVDSDWPAMNAGSDALPSQHALRRMWDEAAGINPTSVPDEALREKLYDGFIRLSDLRRSRLLHARIGLPGILYAALFFGAVLTILVAVLFTVRDLWPHVLKAVALAGLLAFMLLTVWLLDHPFQGQVHVQPTAFGRTLRIVQDDLR